jgi:hypothetical protein
MDGSTEAAPLLPNIGTILLEQGKISAVQLTVGLYLQQHSSAYRGLRLGEILVSCGFISEDALIDALVLQPSLLGEVEQTLASLHDPMQP